jgi:hypothetical protein
MPAHTDVRRRAVPVRLARAVPSGLEVDCSFVPSTDAAADSCRALAREASPRLDAALLEVRLRRYEWVFVARRAGRLRAFLLGQTRVLDGHAFFYFGPLYSTEGAYLPLFAHALRAMCACAPPFWLVAEIERPRLRGLFAHLVPTSWPRADAPTPQGVEDAAIALASSLGHVDGLERSTLRTSCAGRTAQLVVAHAATSAAASAVVRSLDAGLAALGARPISPGRARLA